MDNKYPDNVKPERCNRLGCFTKVLDPPTCPSCHTGHVREIISRQGKRFWGCCAFPQCKWSTNDVFDVNMMYDATADEIERYYGEEPH